MAAPKPLQKFESTEYTWSKLTPRNHLTLLSTPDQSVPNQRLVSVDALRGVAIVSMIIYHFFIDLLIFCSQRVPSIRLIPAWAWETSSTLIGSTFLFLVGFSTWYSARNWRRDITLKKQFLKFTTVGTAALIVTVVSLVATPETPIFFGILHCIATTNLFLCIFLSWRSRYIFAFAFSIFILGVYFRNDPIGTFLFSWIARTQNGKMGDYYPLIPWLAVALLGLAVGKALPSHRYASLQTTALIKYRAVSGLSFLGRHSLSIYLVHQPILILILYLTGLLTSL